MECKLVRKIRAQMETLRNWPLEFALGQQFTKALPEHFAHTKPAIEEAST